MAFATHFISVMLCTSKTIQQEKICRAVSDFIHLELINKKLEQSLIVSLQLIKGLHHNQHPLLRRKINVKFTDIKKLKCHYSNLFYIN